MALVLSYDDLPPGSDIRREILEGRVNFVIPAGELPLHARLRAFYTSIAWATLVSIEILFFAYLLVWGLGSLGTTYSPAMMAIIIALMLVVTGATFALVLRVIAIRRVHVLECARQQATVIAADSERLFIESTGPMGNISRTIARSTIIRIDIVEQQYRKVPIQMIEILLKGEQTLNLAAGRDHGELRWIVRSLRSALGLESEP